MSKLDMKPLEGMLLIRVNKDGDETSKSGLIIPKKGELWQEETLFAEVMAVSDEEKKFKVGDICLMKGYEGRWLDPEYFEDSDKYLYRVVDVHVMMAIVRPKTELEVH